MFKPLFISKLNCCYHIVPKAGNTTVRISMSKWIGKDISKKPYSTKHFDELGKDENVFHFTFVRNPYDRLVSCYYDKIVVGNPPGKVYNGFPWGKLKMSFSDFVHTIVEIPDNKSNYHLVSQHHFTNGSKFIGKIESFQYDWNSLERLLRLPETILTINNNTQHESWEHYYTDELKNLVKKRYANDFHFFGYQT